MTLDFILLISCLYYGHNLGNPANPPTGFLACADGPASLFKVQKTGIQFRTPNHSLFLRICRDWHATRFLPNQLRWNSSNRESSHRIGLTQSYFINVVRIPSASSAPAMAIPTTRACPLPTYTCRSCLAELSLMTSLIYPPSSASNILTRRLP